MGAPPNVPELRPDRLLRQLAEPTRVEARAGDGARDRALGRAGGAVELVLRGRDRLRERGALMLRELRLADWRPTKDTLHLYCQVLGKIRLATTAPRNHWWNVPLYVDVRGLTTRRIQHAGTTFDITLDFVDHAVAVRTADGRTEGFRLHGGLDVAEF